MPWHRFRELVHIQMHRCTLYAHRPSANPEMTAGSQQQLVANGRVGIAEQCSINATIAYNNNSAPCPQLLARQTFGERVFFFLISRSMPTANAEHLCRSEGA